MVVRGELSIDGLSWSSHQNLPFPQSIDLDTGYGSRSPCRLSQTTRRSARQHHAAFRICIGREGSGRRTRTPNARRVSILPYAYQTVRER